MGLEKINRRLDELSDPRKAEEMGRFFKTGAGEYGEGDIFMGIPMPELRKLGKQNKDLPLSKIEMLLKSKEHEKRSLGLAILRIRYEQAEKQEQEALCSFYLKNLQWVNNWDLVDMSAPYILGAENLKGNFQKERQALTKSENLFERRVSLVSTLKATKSGQTGPALKICGQLLEDPEDLINKACGWMLREVYKQDPEAIKRFLEQNMGRMPRVTLRYAIERMDETERGYYLEQ